MRRFGFYTASVVCAASVVLFVVVFVHAVGVPDTLSALDSVPVPASAHSAVATSSPPVRLQIPSLHIDARVQYVGVNAKGALGVPSNFTDVAWYKDGTTPGMAGSAVMDGHVDNALSLPGVFKHLNEIKIGDSVYVKTQDGSTLHFTVYDVENYPYKNVPLDSLFGAADEAHLNLITCDGAWVQGERTYDHRLVVYTQRAE